MAKKKSAASPTSKANKGLDKALGGMQDWNQFFYGQAPGSIDYAQQNPWQNMSQKYTQALLGGSMANNPWMSNLYGNVAGVNMNEGTDMLRDFLSGGPTMGGGRSGGSGAWVPGGQGGYGGGGGGGGYHSSRSSGGEIGDTFDEDTKFGEQAGYFFDDARLDPANDPTLQPMIDAIQRESEESFWGSMQDLQMQLEGAGQFGGSFYQAMMNRGREEYNEAIQATLAQQYQAARETALQKKMEALALLNNRDIAAAQIAAQEAAAAGAAASNAEAIAAQLEIANKQMQLQGIGMMLDVGKFGLGLQGDMASLMQQSQLQAMQTGLGYGQLGMMGYDSAANFGQLGLGALGGMADIYQGRIAEANAMDRFNQQLAWQQQQYRDQAPFNMLNNLINSMRGLNEMGGYGMQPTYIPQPQAPYQMPGYGNVLGGVGAGLQTFFNMNQPRTQGG